MNSIAEVTTKISPIIEVTLNCAEKVPQLFTLKDVFHDLQLAYFWVMAAEKKFTNEVEEEIVSSINAAMEQRPKLPSMISMEERFAFLQEKLGSLTEEMEVYLKDVPLPEEVKYKLDRGYDRLTEASFNINIAIEYYKQIKQTEVNNGK